MDLIGLQNIRGQVRAYQVDGEQWTPRTELKSNLVLYDWANILSKLLTIGDARYRIGGVYLEFENTTSPGDTVSPPTFDRTRSITYYDELVASSSRDYLRVPLTASSVQSTGSGLTNNELLFFARSSGLTGVHGKDFSYAANSVVFDVDSSTTGPKIPENGSDIILSYNYYLPRNDRIILNKDRTFEVVKGIPSLYPEDPKEKEEATRHRLS